MFTGKRILFPRRIPPHAYEEVRSFFVNTLKQFDDVIALYEFGQVKNPGISDLDFAVVYRDAPSDAMIGKKIAQIRFSKAAEDILCGSTLMAFPERTFPSVTLWDDLQLTHRFGKEFIFAKFSPETETLLDICRIVDWLPERVLSLFRVLQGESIVVNRILGTLHSLNYTLRKVGALGISPKDTIEKFDKAITNLRARWFELEEKEQRDQLMRVITEAVSLACACTIRAAQWLEDKGDYRFDKETCKDGVVFSLAPSYGYCFVRDPLQLDWTSLLKKGQPSEMWLPVPVLWAFHLREYAEAGGVIGKKLQRAFSVYPAHGAEVSPELLDLLRKRMALVNEWAEFLYRHHFKKGLFKFGWFY